MKYTLRQLDVFLAAARSQNLSKAADDLAMSQSAASSALKDLEKNKRPSKNLTAILSWQLL